MRCYMEYKPSFWKQRKFIKLQKIDGHDPIWIRSFQAYSCVQCDLMWTEDGRSYTGLYELEKVRKSG